MMLLLLLLLMIFRINHHHHHSSSSVVVVSFLVEQRGTSIMVLPCLPSHFVAQHVSDRLEAANMACCEVSKNVGRVRSTLLDMWCSFYGNKGI